MTCYLANHHHHHHHQRILDHDTCTLHSGQAATIADLTQTIADQSKLFAPKPQGKRDDGLIRLQTDINDIYTSDAPVNGDYAPSYAADERNELFWSSSDYPAGVTSRYWQVDFGRASPPAVTKWTIFLQGDWAGVAAITISASRDESTWVELDVDTELAGLVDNNVKVTREFQNEAAFRYYRLSFLRDRVGAVALGYVQMFE